MAFNRTLQHFTSSQELATVWASGQSYIVNQFVVNNQRLYSCAIAHTSSGSFETDHAAGNWLEVSSGTTPWASGTYYELNQFVEQSDKLYQCTVAHTAGTFATDLSAGKWVGLLPGQTVPIASGGTGQTTQTAAFDALAPTTTKGDIIVHNGTDNVALSSGSYGQILIADSAESSGLKWVTPQQGTKNYITAGTFESGNTNGWSLASSTLDATTKLPNQASGSWSAAAGTLSMSASSSNPLAGLYSLQLSSTATTTAGNMFVTDAITLDLEAQSSVQTFSFFYKLAENGVVTNVTTTSGSPTITVASASGLVSGMVLSSANASGTITNIVGTTVTLSNSASATGTVSGTFTNTLSGTSSNLIGVAIYVNNGSLSGTWIQPAGVFNVVQASGVGKASGTFQVPSDCTSVRLAVYFPNSAGANASYPFTVLLDDFVLGPQPVVSGVPASDWIQVPASGYGTFTGLVATTRQEFYRRVGDSIEWSGYIESTTTGATLGEIRIGLPLGLVADENKIGAVEVRGFIQVLDTSTVASSGALYVSSANNIVPYGDIGIWNSSLNRPFAWDTTDFIRWNVTIPIQGWSSNTVMSNDTDTRVVAFKAYATANTSIPTGAETAITYDAAALIDTHGAWNGTSSYIAPISGYYDVSVGRLGFAANATGARYFVVSVGGSTPNSNLVDYEAAPSGTAITYLNGKTIVYANAGHAIQIKVFQSSGGNLNVGASSSVSITRVSGPATIASSESVIARYKCTTADTTSSSDPINYDLKDIDTHNAVTTGAAWKFTAPISGRYLVNVSQGAATATSNTIYIYINGSGSRILAQGSANIAYSGSDVVSLNAGDYIDIRNGSGTVLTLTNDSTINHIAIERLDR